MVILGFEGNGQISVIRRSDGADGGNPLKSAAPAAR